MVSRTALTCNHYTAGCTKTSPQILQVKRGQKWRNAPGLGRKRRNRVRSGCWRGWGRLGTGEGGFSYRRKAGPPGLVVAATAEGLASVSNETLLARTPLKGAPVSPLLAKNVPPARFLNARTLPVQVLPRSNEKKSGIAEAIPDFFWQGQKDLVSAPLRSARNLRATGTHSPLGTRFWSGCGKAHWGNGGGAELPSSPGQLPEEWCWFGAGDEELQVRQGNGDNLRNSFASSVGPAAQNHKEDGSSHYRPVGENQL